MNIGITGHQRLPDNGLWEWVRLQIRDALKANKATGAYSSLAQGADQVFAEEAIALNIPLHVIIPCGQYDEAFKSSDALKNYYVLLRESNDVNIGDFPKPSGEAYLAAGQSIVSKASQMIAVWDGAPSKGKGGTEDIVKYAKNLNRPVLHLNPIAKIAIQI